MRLLSFRHSVKPAWGLQVSVCVVPSHLLGAAVPPPLQALLNGCHGEHWARELPSRTSLLAHGAPLRVPKVSDNKNFAATGAFGPCLVTADELPPGCVGLKMQSRLNGQVMQSANTADMAFGVARTIALLSESLTLEPGDVIVMGTPGGVGYARTPPVWMKAGDTIEVEIEGLGVLSNPVSA
jgi:Fumarylacetoacetate (FAA) hydrolase family